MNTIVEHPSDSIRHLNYIDRAIAIFSPQTALERTIARSKIHHFAYDSAVPTNARGNSGGMSKNGPSESMRAQSDRLRLMWDARDMERNFGLIGGILDRTAQYTCQRLRYQPQTGSRDHDREYSEYMEEWGSTCDYTQRLHFREMVELAFRGMLRDGDSGFIKRFDGQDIKLQAVEGDCIGNPLQPTSTNDRYISGVGLTERGAPDFFRIFHRTTQGQYDSPIDIPASRFMHLYKPIRTDQYRGFSWLATALPLARDLYEIFACERMAAKWASGHTGFKKVPDPYANAGTGAWNGRNINGVGTETLIPGKITRLGPGEEVIFPNMPDRPNGAFMAHVQAIIRELAMGLNLPYGFVYNMSDFGSASARLETAQAQRSFQRFQHILVDRFLREIKDDVLSNAIARRLVRPHKNWRRGRWNFGAHITADYGYQTQADLQLLAVGAKTQHQMADEQGLDFEDGVETSGAEAEAWYRQGIKRQLPLELINPKFAGATPLLAQMNGPTQEEQDAEAAASAPKNLFESIGDKGGKLILDTMEKVGMGIITHESAVAFLVAMLGLDEQTINAMIPPKGKPQPQQPAAGPKKSKPSGGFRTDKKK